jgi:NAD(P)-dependent dehydrogenase (short-subunit alcohol dehydrogenase family)
MGDLTGKAAFVTGGNIGIGEEIAVYFAQLGADVATTWHSHPAGPVEGKISALGRRALALRVDVTRSVELADAVRRTASELGPLHVLVANAVAALVGYLATEPTNFLTGQAITVSGGQEPV